jgi:hypothetical protein
MFYRVGSPGMSGYEQVSLNDVDCGSQSNSIS